MSILQFYIPQTESGEKLVKEIEKRISSNKMIIYFPLIKKCICVLNNKGKWEKVWPVNNIESLEVIKNFMNGEA